MGNYYARFGGGRMEQGPQGYLASRLPYSSNPAKLRTDVHACEVPGIISCQADMLPVHRWEMALLYNSSMIYASSRSLPQDEDRLRLVSIPTPLAGHAGLLGRGPQPEAC